MSIISQTMAVVTGKLLNPHFYKSNLSSFVQMMRKDVRNNSTRPVVIAIAFLSGGSYFAKWRVYYGELWFSLVCQIPSLPYFSGNLEAQSRCVCLAQYSFLFLLISSFLHCEITCLLTHSWDDIGINCNIQ